MEQTCGYKLLPFAVANFFVGCTLALLVMVFCDTHDVARVLSNRMAGYAKDGMGDVAWYALCHLVVILPILKIITTELSYIFLGINLPCLLFPLILAPSLLYAENVANGSEVLLRLSVTIVVFNVIVAFLIYLGVYLRKRVNEVAAGKCMD